MKKIIVLLTIACFGLTANAQFYLGIKAGGGICNITNPNGQYLHYPGIQIANGLEYKMNVTKRVVLEGDLLFDMRSCLVDDPFETVLTASYISLPLTAHWTTPFKRRILSPYFTGQPNAFWYVEGGVAPMYALTQDIYLDPIALEGLTPEDVDKLEAKAFPFDVAMVGGIGLNFGFKEIKSRLCIGARGYYGLLNYSNYTNAPTMKNIAYGGYIAWDFSLSQKRYYQYRW